MNSALIWKGWFMTIYFDQEKDIVILMRKAQK
jgi:hypothetical protein